jgi:hypothetical protein
MRPVLLLTLCLSAGLTALTPTSVQAQDSADEPLVAQPGPTADVTDLWHRFRHKDEPAQPDPDARTDAERRFFVVAPAIGSKPSTGPTLGINGNMAFFEGDTPATHISSMAGGVRVSQKKQVLSSLRFSVFTEDDRWFLQGDNRLNWTSLNTYDLGSDAEPPAPPT